MVEANLVFNCSSYIKLLKNMDDQTINRHGHCGYLYYDYNGFGAGITANYNEDLFTKHTSYIESRLTLKRRAGGKMNYRTAGHISET